MDTNRKNLVEWTPDEGISPQTDVMGRWFKKEDFNWLPSKSELRKMGLACLLDGWKPDKPIIDQHTRVIGLGSCFARYFILWLADHGFNKSIPDSPYNALIRNSFGFENISVIAQQFRWAFGEFDSRNALWIDRKRELFEATEERRMLVRQTLEQTDVLVLTLGLSEVWYDESSGEPLWRAIPAKYYDPQRHLFRVESIGSTVASLQKIDELRERYLPNLKIIFTVSPVRLKATFRPISAITANSASKAILRAGLDEFLRLKWQEVNKTYYYFPSYEMVTEIFKEPFREDNRHLYDYVPSQILSVFARFFTSYEPSEEIVQDPENEELYRLIAQLEAKNVDLQKVCDERLAVIKDLEAAAQERLELIEQLHRVAQERLVVIERLNVGTNHV